MISPLEYYKQNENVSDEDYIPIFNEEIIKSVFCGGEIISERLVMKLPKM